MRWRGCGSQLSLRQLYKILKKKRNRKIKGLYVLEYPYLVCACKGVFVFYGIRRTGRGLDEYNGCENNEEKRGELWDEV